MTRIITQSEIGTVLECPARWGFNFGTLAGFPIEPKVEPIRLDEGSAWGAAVATFHSLVMRQGVEAAGRAGVVALEEKLDRYAQRAMEAGIYDNEEHTAILDKLIPLFAYYCTTTTPLNLVQAERVVRYPLADGWDYEGRIDGIHQDEDGWIWIVEFKLRDRLTPLEQIVLWRQIRWYSLALRHEIGEVRGVIVDEGHNTKIEPVRHNKDGKVSAVQSCTLEEYMAALRERGNQPPNDNTVERLARKQWHQRHQIVLTDEEYADAEAEVRSAARMVWMYDSGQLLPLRHPGPTRCPGCRYKGICPNPTDERLRDALYRPNTYNVQANIA